MARVTADDFINDDLEWCSLMPLPERLMGEPSNGNGSNPKTPRPMDPAKRCTAHSSDGSGRQCKKARMRGQLVCRAHGGAKPAAMFNAKLKLAAMVEPALDALLKSLKHADDATKVRAAQIVLDRCGFHPTRAIELFGKDGSPIQHDVKALDVDNLSLSLRKMLVDELSAIERGESLADRAYLRIDKGSVPAPKELPAAVIKRQPDDIDLELLSNGDEMELLPADSPQPATRMMEHKDAALVPST